MNEASHSALPLTPDEQHSIDALIGAFFCAFDNRDAPANLAQLHDLVLPSAIVTQVGAEATVVATLEQFIEPRRRLLCEGALTDFHEWEEEAATFRFGAMATRVSRYRKEGKLAGAPYSGNGWKCFQLCLTPEGWRIAALCWNDARDDLSIEHASWVNWPAQPR